MSTTSVPSDLLEPNTHQVFDVTSGHRGLIPLGRRICLIGAMADFALAEANVPFLATTESQVEGLVGQSSEAAMMYRSSNRAGKKYGAQPEVWICPIADPGGGTKATFTVTFTGPATDSGTVRLRIQGQIVGVGIHSGDTATTMALNAQKAIAAKAARFAAVATVNAGVVTMTLVNAGVNGNDLVVEVLDQIPAGVTVVAAAGVAGAGDADPQPALDALIDKRYNAVVLANHKNGDLDDLSDHVAEVNASAKKLFTTGYIASRGNLTAATTLATHQNEMETVVVQAEKCPRLPCEIAANIATIAEAEEDTARSFDNVETDLEAPPAAYVPESSSVETALRAGVCILGVNSDNSRMRIIRLVTTKSSIGAVPFLDVLDISTVRTLHWLALQIDAAWQIAFPRAKRNERTRQRVYSVTLRVLKQAEEIERIHNVDDHKAELVVENDDVNTGRFNVAIPAPVIPNLHSIVGVNKLILE